MSRKFIDREEELAFLNKAYSKGGFEFFVIYGRRRIGKTELIKEFLKGKPSIYLLLDRSGTARNMYRLKKKISEFLNEPLIATEDPEEIFSYLAGRKDGRFVVALDEFSHLVEKDDGIPSIFQVIADEILKRTNIFLVLCGSSVSMMEKGVLSQKSPLYGRKTAHIRMAPMPFRHFREFFPSNGFEKNVEFHAILGGVPFYLEKFSDRLSTFENVRKQILSKDGRLYEEIDFLLKEELREPDTYKSILSSIASGSTKVAEIANKSRIKVQDMDKYLKVLQQLGIIKREIPVTETKSKKSAYAIDDNFFRFCFTFSEPFKSDLEIRNAENALARLKQVFPNFMGKQFEKLVREEILGGTGIIQAQKTGRWWGAYRDEGSRERKAHEIDIVALNEQTKEILFAECKWQDRADARKILAELKEKAGYVQWNNGRRKEHYAIFAKSFRDRNIAGAKLYDLKDIEKAFRQTLDRGN